MAIELIVVTPEGEALAETVEQVVLPGEVGEFGVLESHERFLTPLQPGPVLIHRENGHEWAALSGGFAEVDGKRCVVLADFFRLASAIDVAKVEKERAAADDALAALPEGDANADERARLEARVARADLELDVASR